MLVVVVSVTYDIVITAELTSSMFNIQCSPETTDYVNVKLISDSLGNIL